jgi:hypothetical protein
MTLTEPGEWILAMSRFKRPKARIVEPATPAMHAQADLFVSRIAAMADVKADDATPVQGDLFAA